MSPPAMLKLNTGAYMPTLGLGTWQSKPGQVEDAVAYALKNAGYRHVDTAAEYGNEKAVGDGIKGSGVPRHEVFLTTKLNNTDHKAPKAALDHSLKQLGTDYLDLWLMHWPAPQFPDESPDRSIDWLDTWKGMENIFTKNKHQVRAIGVSNFSVEYLQRLLKGATVVPAVNQIELHPSCTQQDIRDFCQAQGIVVTAYCPLGSENSPLLKDKVVLDIAERHGVSPANVLISLQVNQPNTTVIPKSVMKERIKSNTNIVTLIPEEISALNAIEKTRRFRVCGPEWTGWGDLGFPDCKLKGDAASEGT